MATKILTKKEQRFIEGVAAIRDPETEAFKELAYWGWMWAQAALPHSKPDRKDVWSRENGAFSLTIQSGVDVVDGRTVYTGIPYGSVPRLLIAWMCSEAVRTKSPRLFLGDSFSQFMRKVGLGSATGGKTGTITRVKDQMLRLFEARISYRWRHGKNIGRARRDMQIAREDVIIWSERHARRHVPFESYLVLSDQFFAELTRNPIPLKVEALRLLKQSALAIDLYTWVCWRIFKVNEERRAAEIPWAALHKQFGSNYKNKADFAKKCKSYLQRIKLLYPELRYDVEEPGLLILRPSHCHVRPLPRRRQTQRVSPRAA